MREDRRKRTGIRMRPVAPSVLCGSHQPLGWWDGVEMVAAGAGATRLLLLLLMVAAAPSRARGSSCRTGATARGVSGYLAQRSRWGRGKSWVCRWIKVATRPVGIEGRGERTRRSEAASVQVLEGARPAPGRRVWKRKPEDRRRF
jgi:hypothetical protein